MKTIKYFLAIAMLSAAATSCDLTEFGDINKSPNAVSNPNTGQLFTYATNYTRLFVMNDYSYDIWPQAWNGYFSESVNNQYGPLGATDQFNTNSYYLYAIRNLQYVIDLNKDESVNKQTYVSSFGDTNDQIGVASTLQAFFYLKLTDILGPIVYSEALKGPSEDIWKPKYDTQKEVYTGLFKQLTEAYSLMNASGKLSSNDIMYNGNVARWKMLNASIRMMMALRLADVDPATGKTEFVKAYNDGGIVKNADNWKFTHNVNSLNYLHIAVSPAYPSNSFSGLWVPNTQIVDTLKAYNDPRMFEYFELVGYKGFNKDKDPKDIQNYNGVKYGYATNSDVEEASKGCCSFNKKYYGDTDPMTIVSAAHILFCQAEAAQLGWISADAKDLYEKAVKASFEQWEAAGVDEFLAGKGAFKADDALYCIALQRWVADFMSDGVEAWSDWRRTDIPFRPVGPGAYANGIESYPSRHTFASSERQYNKEMYEAAINDLSDKTDSRWSRVWWDVKDNRTGHWVKEVTEETE